MNISIIKLYNFKSFAGWHELEFSGSGIYKIEGTVGAGKTTIGEALVFALYGTVEGKNNKDLIHWGEKRCWVHMCLEHRGVSIYIKREICSYGQSELIVEMDGTPLGGPNKASIQGQLEEFIGVPRIFVEMLCVVSFGNFRSLSSMNMKDQKSFSSNILGLDILDQYSSVWKNRIKDLNQEINFLEGQLSVFSVGQEIVSPPDPLVIEEKISQENAIKQANIEYNTIKTQSDRWERDYKSEVTKAEHHNKLVRKGCCPTCGQSFKGEEIEIPNRVNIYKDRLQEMEQLLEEKRSKLAVLEGEIMRQTLTYENYIKTTHRNRGEVDKITKQLNHCREELHQCTELVDLFRGSLMERLVDEFIPSINNNIAKIASMLSLPYEPRFDNKFSCYLREGIPVNSLSTGQRKLVDMTVAMGVLGSVMSRVDMNVIFLDELFSNLDQENRDRFIGVMRELLSDKLVFVVSHQDILCDGVVKIVNKDGRSMIEIEE